MRGAIMHAPGDVRVEERDDPTIIEPTDAIIRLSATCVCGSDLWPYRGIEPIDGPTPMGHEYVGVVEEIGSDVKHRQARPVRRRLVLRLRQHLRDLPGRLPVPLRARASSIGRRSAPRPSTPASRSPTAPWSPPPSAARRRPDPAACWPPPTCSAPAGSPPSPPRPARARPSPSSATARSACSASSPPSSSAPSGSSP